MKNLNQNLKQFKKDVEKYCNKNAKYFSSSNQICRISSLPEKINIKDSLGIGRKEIAPCYVTVSNYAALTIHFFWKDGMIHVHQFHVGNYASERIQSIVTLDSIADVESWLKEIKYFIMQKCGWSSQKYRQFKASTYAFILDALNKRNEYQNTLGDHLKITDLVQMQSEKSGLDAEIKVSKKCRNINFVSAWRFHEMQWQGANGHSDMVMLYRAKLDSVINLGLIADHTGKILKANIFDPLALIASKNVSQPSVEEKMQKVIYQDIFHFLEIKTNFEEFSLIA